MTTTDERPARRRDEKRTSSQTLVESIKLERGCMDCGYSGHPRALDFDHIGDGKAANISQMVRSGVPADEILAEIAKCEVVCSNCHRIRTWSRSQNEARPIAVPITAAPAQPVVPTSPSIAGLRIDDVVAIRLTDGTCPIGEVRAMDASGVRLALYHWMHGWFDGTKPRVVLWAHVEGVLHAHPVGQNEDGAAVYGMDPLGTYQTEWVEQHKGAKPAPNRVEPPSDDQIDAAFTAGWIAAAREVRAQADRVAAVGTSAKAYVCGWADAARWLDGTP